MTSRYTQIDIAKGIGILSIVLGHNYVVVQENEELFNVLFSFHVPLFFFLSGLFMKFNNDLRSYTFKKLDSYLKPYFVTLILLGVVIAQFEGINLVKYFVGIVYGTGPGLPVGWVQLWFLPHLFAVSVLSYLCCSYTNLMSETFLFKAIFLVIILSMGFLGITYFWNIPVPGTHTILPGLPFSIDLILLSSVYFLLGSFLKQDVLSMDFNWLMLVFVAVIFAFIHFRFNYTINLNMRRYDHIFISTITALIGIYLVISVSIMLKGTPIISKLLSYIGSASLFILIFHNYIQMKTIMLLGSLTGNKYIIFAFKSFASFTMAVLVPILFYELIKRTKAIKMLFLPIKSSKGIRTDVVEPRL